MRGECPLCGKCGCNHTDFDIVNSPNGLIEHNKNIFTVTGRIREVDTTGLDQVQAFSREHINKSTQGNTKLEALYSILGKMIYEECQQNTIIICRDIAYNKSETVCAVCSEKNVCETKKKIQKEIENILEISIDNIK